MVNFREVNDNDILLYRADEIASLSCDEDRKHWVYFDEISDKILRSIPKNNREYVKNNLTFLMTIFLIILVIGMKNIIGMVLLMVYS